MFAFLLLLTASCSLLTILVGCKRKYGGRPVETLLPDQVVEGFKLTETVEGKLLYELEAETARVYDDSNRIEVVLPKVKFFDENEQRFSILTAATGRVNTKTSDLVAKGNVRVETRDSTLLDTDSLVWRNKERIVTTDAPVNMQGPKGNISGIGLVSDAGLKRIEIKQSVQATTKYEFNR